MSKKKKESKPKKTKNKAPKGKSLKNVWQSAVLQLLDSAPGKAYSMKQLLKKLGLKKREDIKQATHLIYQLADAERIKELSNGSYITNREREELTGIVDHVSSRFAYVRLGADKEDIFVKARDMASAVDGDTVKLE